MIRILGIDPGSRLTGFGVIEIDARKSRYLTSGCIRTGTGSLPERLAAIFAGISDLVEQFQPHEMAIEQVFMNRNADSALKLGQARGAAITAAVCRDITVHQAGHRRPRPCRQDPDPVYGDIDARFADDAAGRCRRCAGLCIVSRSYEPDRTEREPTAA